MTHPLHDSGLAQIGMLGDMPVEQNPRGFTRVTIEVDVWVGSGAHASAWSVAENVEVSMKNACDSVAKELACPDEGVDVIVR